MIPTSSNSNESIYFPAIRITKEHLAKKNIIELREVATRPGAVGKEIELDDLWNDSL